MVTCHDTDQPTLLQQQDWNIGASQNCHFVSDFYFTSVLHKAQHAFDLIMPNDLAVTLLEIMSAQWKAEQNYDSLAVIASD